MYQEVNEFWIEEIDKSQWWVKDEDFDELIRKRFVALQEILHQSLTLKHALVS